MNSKAASSVCDAERPGPTVAACGDDAILIDFQGCPDPNQAVRALWARLMADLPGYCEEPVAGVATLAVVLKEQHRNEAMRRQACDALMPIAKDAVGASPEPGRHVVIQVCYDMSMAPDLERVAALTGLTTQEVVALHQSGRYLAELIGFVPGFAYMSGMDSRLAVPRLPEPRPVVPAGSLGITGNQCAVYPTATPGGWNLIGRSPTRLFDPRRPDPCWVKLGDVVEFEPISVAQFDRLWAKR